MPRLQICQIDSDLIRRSAIGAALAISIACGQRDVSFVASRASEILALAGVEQNLRATRPSDRVIVLTRSFAASRQRVFDALTQAERMMVWMKSAAMPIVACEVDSRVGGTFRHVSQRQNGRTIEVRGVYRSFEPPSRLAHAESFDFSPLTIFVTTVLDEVDGKTVFTQTLSYPSTQERDDDFEGVVTSATEAYANLERYLRESAR